MNTLVLEKEIDLNSLFTMSYNFDLLKTLMQELLKSNKNLSQKVSDLNLKVEDNENYFKLELQKSKEKYDNLEGKIAKIDDKLDKHDSDIKDLYSKFNSLNIKFDQHEIGINNRKDKNNEQDEKLNSIFKRLDKIDLDLKNLGDKILNLNFNTSIVQPIKSEDDLDDTQRFLKMLDSLKIQVNNKFDFLGAKVDKNTKDIEELQKELMNFKDNINYLMDKLEELKKLIIINNKDDVSFIIQLENNLKKYIDAKLNDILKELQIKFSSQQISNITNISENDIKLINDLLRRVIELENLYRLITNQPKVDDLEKEIKKIYAILETKADKKDIDILNKKYDDLYDLYLKLLKRVDDLEKAFSLFSKYDFDKMLKDINDLKLKMDSIYSKILEGSGGGKIDLSFLVDFETFNKFKGWTENEIALLKKQIEEIKISISNFISILNNKVDIDALNKLEGNLLKKIEELKISSIKRFADKNDTNNNFRLIEEQLKLLMEMKNNADNWLLAKKPIGGNYCASCETYIGDLKENKEYLAWNKWPSKDDRSVVKRGPGFSKMLQLVNADPIMNIEEYDNLNKMYQHKNIENYYHRDKEFDGKNERNIKSSLDERKAKNEKNLPSIMINKNKEIKK